MRILSKDKKKNGGDTGNNNGNTSVDPWDIPSIPNTVVGESRGEEEIPQDRPKKKQE